MKTYKDVYELPLHTDKYGSWVWDAKGNFVFQFSIDNEEIQDKILDVINGKETLTNPNISFRHDRGRIITNSRREIILIRGWGNLTGTGAMNLPPEEAMNIQDTFAEFIVEQLNRRQ